MYIGLRTAALAAMAMAVLPVAQGRPLSVGPDVERFREQCRAQYAYLRGPGQHEVVVAHVRACVQAKLQSLVRTEAAVPVDTSKPLALVEFTPWLLPAPRGPAAAKGAIYFVEGFEPGGMLDGFHLDPYFLRTLTDAGWDVIAGKIPKDASTRRGAEIVSGGAATIARRVKELREQGYRRVVAGGHSWGAWATMLAERAGILSADVLLLSAPATFGPRISPFTGRPNPTFAMNASQFPPLAEAIKTPSIVLFMKDDIFDPGGRGPVAGRALSQHGVAYLVIDQPAGFIGHYAGWLPVFDYEYGGCIASFLDAPVDQTCAPAALVNDDFRSIVSLKQVADADQKRITSAAPLAGRKFVAYTLHDVDNKHFDYVSASQRVVMESASEHREAVSFRDGRHCVDKTCSVLLQWSEHEILEFDSTGALKAWWVEDVAG